MLLQDWADISKSQLLQNNENNVGYYISKNVYDKITNNGVDLTKDAIPINFLNYGKWINTLPLPSDAILSNSYNKERIKQDLNFLNNRLNFIKKDLTEWDLKNIYDSIDEQDDINKILLMPTNSSIVVNGNITFNNIKLKKGDYIIKKQNNQYAVIQSSQVNGVYIPTKIENNKLFFEFYGSQPREITIPIGTNTISHFYYPPIDVNIYNPEDLTNFHLQCLYSGDNLIFPVIRTFYNEEEVIFDYSLERNTEEDYYYLNAENLRIPIKIKVK